MREEELLAKAIAFASEKHMYQERRNGTPYIYHPFFVANLIKDCGYGIKYQVTAILHDVLEDTDATEKEVAEFGPDILIAVRLLTRKPGQDEYDYVQKILRNHIASVVKNADKIHNLYESMCEDMEFRKRYAKKASVYYKGKFSKALDDAISVTKNPFAETFNNTIFPKMNLNEMKLYSDIEAEKKEQLKQEYKSAERINFCSKFIEYLTFDHQMYFCGYGHNGLCYEKIWQLTKAGWLPCTRDIEADFGLDLETVSEADMRHVIENKLHENYFYDFVMPITLRKEICAEL